MNEYVYHGDKMTAPGLKKRECRSVRRPDGKCIRGKNGSMLVHFPGVGDCVVIGRLLRKIKK